MMSLGMMSILYVWCTGKVQFCKGHSKCTQCGVYQRQSLADFVKAGFWPGTPDGNKFETIIDQRVFQRFAALKDRSLQLSTKAWLEAFAEESHDYGGQVRLLDINFRCHQHKVQVAGQYEGLSDLCLQGEPINASAFSASYIEWRYCQHDVRSGIQCVDELVCAACQPAPHSVHVDANMKLFVYGRGREPWRLPYHAGLLFLCSAEGVEHMKTTDIALGTKVSHSHIACPLECCVVATLYMVDSGFTNAVRRMIAAAEGSGLRLETERAALIK